MNPEQILAALREVYAGCRTYRDRGHVVAHTCNLDDRPDREFVWTFRTGYRRPHRSWWPSRTGFRRPARFRFEHRLRAGGADRFRGVVWAAGGEARAWGDGPPRSDRPGDLGTALGRENAISGGAARAVPPLLLPDQVAGGLFAGLTDLAGGGEEGGCYRLTALRRSDVVLLGAWEIASRMALASTGVRPERPVPLPMTIWIDCGTLLLSRIEEATRFETFRSERVTTYEPEVDAEVPDDELQFDPPAVEV